MRGTLSPISASFAAVMGSWLARIRFYVRPAVGPLLDTPPLQHDDLLFSPALYSRSWGKTWNVQWRFTRKAVQQAWQSEV